MAELDVAPTPWADRSPDPTSPLTSRQLAHAAPTTLAAVRGAWGALSRRRRRWAVVGVGAALVCGAAATAVAPLTSAIAIAIVGVLAGAAAVIDVHEHRLPNRLLSLSLATVVVAAGLDGAWVIVDVVVGLAMAALPLWIVRYGKGLALGDVKFAAVLGAATGLVHPFAGLIVVWVAALTGGVFALRTGRRRLAFGPWLWAGYLTAGLAAVVFVQVVLEMGGRSWPVRP